MPTSTPNGGYFAVSFGRSHRAVGEALGAVAGCSKGMPACCMWLRAARFVRSRRGADTRSVALPGGLPCFSAWRVLKLSGLQGNVNDPGPFSGATAVVVAAKQESAG
jgi:hypothetical protein